jgi:hypothetical protein
MPRKRTDSFQKLTIEQQQEMIDRRKVREEVSKAITELALTVLSWVIGQDINKREFLELFHASGHRGEYQENPSVTTYERVTHQSIRHLTKRLNDTPLDYMGAVELSYVYERVMLMIDRLQSLPDGGTAQNAIDLYELVGEVIRQKVFVEMGHYPEEFPIPYGRITGDEEPTQFKLTDHQPPLF